MAPIVRSLKRAGVAGVVILLGAYLLFWAYSLPRHAKVHVTGTEIKREDVERPDGEIRTRDVRFITAEALDGTPRMFRNEDTGWGWPPYFKFDSGDVAAQANAFATDPGETVVLVRFYGFRIRMLSLYPNVVSMQSVDADYEAFPWIPLFVSIAHVVLLGAAMTTVRAYRQDLGRRDLGHPDGGDRP